jgi:hypothetical protein
MRRKQIDLGPCVSFGGKVGEVIQIALEEPHNPVVSLAGFGKTSF